MQQSSACIMHGALPGRTSYLGIPGDPSPALLLHHMLSSGSRSLKFIIKWKYVVYDGNKDLRLLAEI